MSEFKAPLTTIKQITPHPNTEVLKLEIAHVYGFQVVVQKDRYKVGDAVLYVPIDSVLSSELESFIFPPGSKITLHNSRVKQIRIRQFASAGMLINSEDVKVFTKNDTLPALETDMSSIMGISKYEPPAPSWQSPRLGGSRNKPLENPLFHKFNGLENIKWHTDMFTSGHPVVIQEKLHGSNIRAGILPTLVPSLSNILSLLKEIPQRNQKLSNIKSLFNMIKRIVLHRFNLLPKFDKCYGSNNVELTNRVGYTGYYGEDVYGKVLEKVKAFDKIKPNEIIFGELIGSGIQKGYDYGHKNEHHFVLFDVKILNDDGSFTWLCPDDVEAFAKERGFDMVPILYKGQFDKDAAYQLTKGNSVYDSNQKIREGIVIKSRFNYNDNMAPNQRLSLKWLSEEYLDKNNSDFH